MEVARRGLLLAVSVCLPVMAMRAARADTTDLAVLCDLTLGPALRAAGAAYDAHAGVRIHVFPTPPGLIVPQLARDVQIDVVVTQPDILDRAVAAGLLAGPRSGNWADPLVIAEPAGAAGPADGGKFALSELPAASGIDGAAVAAGLGVPTERIASAIDTREVAFLLTSGAARAGLLYRTDVRTDPRLRALRVLADPPPAVFAAAVTKGARRPNPAAFVAFLATSPAVAVLADHGLETVA